MKKLFERPWFPELPGAATLPKALFWAALLGAAAGPLIGAVFGWFVGAPAGAFAGAPVRWMLHSFAIGAIFSVSFYLTCAVPVPWMARWVDGWPRWSAWPVVIATAMVGGSLGCVIAILSVRHLLHIHVVSPVSMSRLIAFDAILAALIAIVLGIYSQKELRARRAAEAAARAQSYALQSQINPHFFFNTLNTISALIPSDPAAAQRMIGRLAEMFRYTLACGQADLVPLEREVDFVRNYLELEKERFRQRLTFRLPEAAETSAIMLPGLTLQPLVENAVRHGVAKRLEGGEVRVQVARENGTAVVAVVNQTDGPATIEVKPGHAVANVRDRLRLAFGDRSALSWRNANPDTLAVELRVPLA